MQESDRFIKGTPTEQGYGNCCQRSVNQVLTKQMDANFPCRAARVERKASSHRPVDPDIRGTDLVVRSHAKRNYSGFGLRCHPHDVRIVTVENGRSARRQGAHHVCFCDPRRLQRPQSSVCSL